MLIRVPFKGKSTLGHFSSRHVGLGYHSARILPVRLRFSIFNLSSFLIFEDSFRFWNSESLVVQTE